MSEGAVNRGSRVRECLMSSMSVMSHMSEAIKPNQVKLFTRKNRHRTSKEAMRIGHCGHRTRGYPRIGGSHSRATGLSTRLVPSARSMRCATGSSLTQTDPKIWRDWVQGLRNRHARGSWARSRLTYFEALGNRTSAD